LIVVLTISGLYAWSMQRFPEMLTPWIMFVMGYWPAVKKSAVPSLVPAPASEKRIL
jgi:hypothetical protein